MKCEQIRPLLLPYLDDEAAPSEKAVVQAHLSTCQACRGELAALAGISRRLQAHLSVQAEAVSPPGQIPASLLARLRSVRPDKRLKTPFHPSSDVFPPRKGSTTMKKLAFAAVCLLTIVVGLIAFTPGVRAQVDTQVADVVQQVALSAYTWAARVVPGGSHANRPIPSDMWIIHTDIGNYGGNIAPGQDPSVRITDNLLAAQSLVDFQILAPADLPAGYALEEVKLAPIGGTHWAFLKYTGPGSPIYIVQMPVGPQPSASPDTSTSVAVGILTDGSLEEVDFDGRPAAWIEGHSLSWEMGGIHYNVGGLDLDLDAAMQIGRSLR